MNPRCSEWVSVQAHRHTGTAGWFDFLQQTAVSDESLTAKSGWAELLFEYLSSVSFRPSFGADRRGIRNASCGTRKWKKPCRRLPLSWTRTSPWHPSAPMWTTTIVPAPVGWAAPSPDRIRMRSASDLDGAAGIRRGYSASAPPNGLFSGSAGAVLSKVIYFLVPNCLLNSIKWFVAWILRPRSFASWILCTSLLG